MENKDELNVLWTTADPNTAELMILLYTMNAKKRGWFNDINIIIWGASSKLIATNEKINNLVREAIALGINFNGCLHCASELNVVKELEETGITLEYMGVPLTELLKSNKNFLSL